MGFAAFALVLAKMRIELCGMYKNDVRGRFWDFENLHRLCIFLALAVDATAKLTKVTKNAKLCNGVDFCGGK